MPSLRRTASTPAVRASPYSNTPLTARGHGYRRSSGSDTVTRRVLADIEWWRVTDGQCDSSSDQETEDRIRGTQNSASLDEILSLGIPLTHVEAGVDHPALLSGPRTATDDLDSIATTLFEPPTEQFSTLAITPHTPTRRSQPLESTSSSLESTPEAGAVPLSFDLEVALADAFFYAPPIQKHNHLSVFFKRSLTFPDCLSLKEDRANPYADFAISPLSSAPDFLN